MIHTSCNHTISLGLSNIDYCNLAHPNFFEKLVRSELWLHLKMDEKNDQSILTDLFSGLL